MNIPDLTPAEEQLMLLLWPLEGFYLKDAMAAQPEPKPHQNTVSTYLKILIEKNYLKAEKQGRIYRYTPTVSLTEYRAQALHRILETFYSGDSAALINDLKTRSTSAEPHAPNAGAEPTEQQAIGNINQERNHIREMLEELLEGKKKKKKGKKKK